MLIIINIYKYIAFYKKNYAQSLFKDQNLFIQQIN